MTNSTYIDNYALNNGAVGFSFEFYITNINFSNNTALRNGYTINESGYGDGIQIEQISNSTIMNNTANQNFNDGYAIGTLPGDLEPGPSSHNTIIGNSAKQNNGANNSHSSGFIFYYLQNSNLINNTSNNNNNGIVLLTCSNNNLINNSALNNKIVDFSEDTNTNSLRNNNFPTSSNSLTSLNSFSNDTYLTFIILLLTIICILIGSGIFVSIKEYRKQLLSSNLDKKQYPFSSYVKDKLLSFRKKPTHKEDHSVINDAILEKIEEIISESENDQIPK